MFAFVAAWSDPTDTQEFLNPRSEIALRGIAHLTIEMEFIKWKIRAWPAEEQPNQWHPATDFAISILSVEESVNQNQQNKPTIDFPF